MILYSIRGYWKLYVFSLIIGILFRFIRDFLTGKYISEASIIEEYLLVMLIGKILSISFYQAFEGVCRRLLKPKYSTLSLLYGGFSWFIFCRIVKDFFAILFELIGYFLLPVIFGLLPIKIILLSILFSFVILFLTYGTALIFLLYSLNLGVREDISYIF